MKETRFFLKKKKECHKQTQFTEINKKLNIHNKSHYSINFNYKNMLSRFFFLKKMSLNFKLII